MKREIKSHLTGKVVDSVFNINNNSASSLRPLIIPKSLPKSPLYKESIGSADGASKLKPINSNIPFRLISDIIMDDKELTNYQKENLLNKIRKAYNN